MSTLKSWYLNSYTNNTWTDFIAGASSGDTIKGINISNTSAGAISIEIRVSNSINNPQATILPTTSIAAGRSFVLELDPLNLVGSQKLQVYISSAGIHLYASGVTY